MERKIHTLFFLTESRGLVNSLRDFLFLIDGIRKVIGVPIRSKDLKPALDPTSNLWEWEAKRTNHKVRSLGEIDLNEEKYWNLSFPQRKKMKPILS